MSTPETRASLRRWLVAADQVLEEQRRLIDGTSLASDRFAIDRAASYDREAR